MWKRHNGLNQRWTILYTKGKKAAATSGKNDDFGFEINKSFYFVSRMAMRRVIQVDGGGVRLKRRVRKNTGQSKQQQWYFDEKSKALKTRWYS